MLSGCWDIKAGLSGEDDDCGGGFAGIAAIGFIDAHNYSNILLLLHHHHHCRRRHHLLPLPYSLHT